MHVPLVIDHVVRQTMVLIAQLATTGGHRAPLARVADQVFRDLTHALEEQGVRRKVVADMFGLALRSYQQKVRRLGETSAGSGKSLWEAVYSQLGEQTVLPRADLLERFRHNDPASVVGVAEDMVSSGLAFRSGRGDAAVYRLADSEDLARAMLRGSEQTRAAIVWSVVYREGPASERELEGHVELPEGELHDALTRLQRMGCIESEEVHGELRYSSARIYLPLGDPMGWEAGLVDHYQAVVATICAKLRNGQTRATPDDQLGGSTFTFDVWPGHPHEHRVRSLLADHRRQLAALWDAVTEFNSSGRPASHRRVTFYFGQTVTDHGADPSEKEEA